MAMQMHQKDIGRVWRALRGRVQQQRLLAPTGKRLGLSEQSQQPEPTAMPTTARGEQAGRGDESSQLRIF